MYISIICLPTLFLICSINLIISPDDIYECDYMDEVIGMARLGYNATNVESKLDERLFKKKYAELYNSKEIDYLILGSSRQMTISSEAVNGCSVLNLAISGAKIEDLIAIYQVSKDNNIKAKNFIIGIDPLLFNSNYGGDWWKTISEYYYKFEKIKTYDNYNRMRDRCFSIDYFRLAINSIRKNEIDKAKILFTKSYVNNGYTRRKDGAVYYPKIFREKELDEVNDMTERLNIDEYNFDSLSMERKNRIVKLIDTIKNDGCNIIFLCCPYHPILYQRITQRQCVDNTEKFINEMAIGKQISVIGHFDPRLVGFKKEDFYDAQHPKKESLDNYMKKYLIFNN